jgi:hypothetical protein
MGVYYKTFLCSGKFTNQTNNITNKKVIISSMDQIIEQKEWNNQVVDKDELEKFVTIQKNIPSSFCGTCDDSRGKIYDDIQLKESNESDLFLEELCFTTYDDDDKQCSKYILVQRGYTYEI